MGMDSGKRKGEDPTDLIADAICTASSTLLPKEIFESYQLTSQLTFPIASEKLLAEQVVSVARDARLTDADVSGTLVCLGLYLQGFPLRDASEAVQKLHARIMRVIAGRAFPLPKPPLVPDLPFAGESRRSALAGSAEFDDTPCGRAATDLLASGGFSGLFSVARLRLAVGQCKLNMPGYSGPCADAARNAFAEEFLARFVATGSADPDAPISGPFLSRADMLEAARQAAAIAAQLAYTVCRISGVSRAAGIAGSGETIAPPEG